MLLAAGLVPLTPREEGQPCSRQRRLTQGLRHRVLRGRLEEVAEDCCLVLMYEDAERARVQTPPATPPCCPEEKPVDPTPTLRLPPQASRTSQASQAVVPLGTGLSNCSEVTLFARPQGLGVASSLLFPALYAVAAPAATPEECPGEAALAPPGGGGTGSDCGLLDCTERTVLCDTLVEAEEEEEEELPEKPGDRAEGRKPTLGSVATTATAALRSGPARGGC